MIRSISYAHVCFFVGLFQVLLFTPATFSQIEVVYSGNADWTWEGSADGGVTWHNSLIQIDRALPSLLVRATCSFDRPTSSRYFGFVAFDATVENAGDSDHIDSIEFGGTRMLGALPALNVQRLGSTLKVDYTIDTSPPGQGLRWLTPGNSHPSVPIVPDTSHPFTAMTYSLVLDGTPGDRLLSAAYQSSHPSLRSGQWLWSYDANNTSTTTMQALHAYPLTVRVVPSPSVLGLLAAAFMPFTRRRRH